MLPRHTAQPLRVSAPPILVFDLDGGRFAVPASQVFEVVRLESHAPLPCENPAHLGVVLHRGSMLPLVDLKAQLGIRRRASGGLPGLCLILRGGSGHVVCPVDEVVGLAPSAEAGFSWHATLPGDIDILRAIPREAIHG